MAHDVLAHINQKNLRLCLETKFAALPACRHPPCPALCRCHGLLQTLPDNLGGLSGHLTHLSIETASLAHLPESLGELGSLLGSLQHRLQGCDTAHSGCASTTGQRRTTLTFVELLACCNTHCISCVQWPTGGVVLAQTWMRC
jgi:hypothetical protein